MEEVSPIIGDDSQARKLGSKEASTARWWPSRLVFGPYLHQNEAGNKLHVVARKSLVGRLTKDIVETYQACNPKFKYTEELNPKRYLTSPSIGVLNDGCDNVNSDLILAVNYALINLDSQRRYIVKDVLGHGTFGQVAKCWVAENSSFVAVKIIKNQPAYYQQALVEVSILTTLNKKYDPEDKHHIVRIYDYFVYQCHLCICFELLDTNLYELIKINHFRGLSLSIVQLFSKQILHGLALLKDAAVIHCDLKPENILLCTSVKPAEIKIIDFGSACMEDRTVYSYIQSRYYRSPEVLLGYQYTTAIDMWSFGCIVAELFLGLPLFPGASEFDLLRRMVEILGGRVSSGLYVFEESAPVACSSIASLLQVHCRLGHPSLESMKKMVPTLRSVSSLDLKKPSIGKEYFNHRNLEDIVTNYPYRKNLPREDVIKESQIRLALIDFLRGLVEFDPAKRWSPFQASKHPFVTGEPFTFPYKPAQETPRMPVAQNFKVDHHPGGGHWFAAGLSPNIPGRNRVALQNSPHYPVVPYAHANSYGSVGSHGSYNDGNGLGSSYGSYGDSSNMFAYYSPVGPSAMNLHAQGGVSMLGSSPDARRRMIQYSHGNGLGMSPSARNFAPLPLGTSPSQFTPPSSYNQVSVGSPGHFGPPSPARNSSQGSPLGKVATVSHLNRRKGWGYSGSTQSQESSSLHLQGHFNDGIGSSQAEGSSQLLAGSPSLLSNPSTANWKQQRGVNVITGGFGGMQKFQGASTLGSHMQFPVSTGAAHENPEAGSSLPDPADWDPNYSDELLLQEDCSDASCITTDFSKNMHLGSAEQAVGVGRFSNALTTSSNLSFQRQNGPIQAYSQLEVGSPPSHDSHVGLSRSMSKASHFMTHSQNSPSRLGQQPVHQFNHVRPSAVWVSDWNHIKVQPPQSGFNSEGPHSPRSSSFSTGIPWGRRTNHSVTNIPPASRGRKDYGRIS
ncbi:Pkinase domain-containing protein [Cephalotus follicularis]|uniref:Pkinase domain-containing protein n=1 Tax=Cephalotus follicularis TaxID=3775 RepID=A0A1Q3C0X6_CEPFO|nr:Pkinase domain-containing protein [Cephalotus follicularis]